MNKIEIAIIELNDHPVFLDSLIEVFTSNTNFETSIYISAGFKNKFGYSVDKMININIQKENQTNFQFIKENEDSINSNKAIFFSTPNLQILSEFDFKPTTILNIHNLNTWLNKSSADFREIRKNVPSKIYGYNLPDKIYNYKLITYNIKLLRSIKLYLMERLYYKKKRAEILNKINAINLLHPNMNNLIHDEIKIMNFPFRFPNNNKMKYNKLLKNNCLNIGIIGHIEQGRKDYIGFLNFLKEVDLKFKLKIMFLGTFTKDKEFKETILRLIKDTNNSNIEFELFKNKNFIEQKLFDEKMEEIDIIFAPIQNYKYNRNFYKEQYGVSKATGSDFDAFFYKKPIIMPDFYKGISYLMPIYNFYSNYRDLLELLEYYSIERNLIKKYNMMDQNIYNRLEEIKLIFLDQLNELI